MLREKKFNTQKEAVEYYGHSWKWIENHKKVRRCYSFTNGFRGYFISSK